MSIFVAELVWLILINILWLMMVNTITRKITEMGRRGEEWGRIKWDEEELRDLKCLWFRPV